MHAIGDTERFFSEYRGQLLNSVLNTTRTFTYNASVYACT